MSGTPYIVGNVVEAVEEFDEHANPVLGVILIRADGNRRTWVHGHVNSQPRLNWLHTQAIAGVDELMAAASKGIG